MRRSVSLLLVIAVFGGASSAAAKDKQAKGSNGKLFAALDQDGDGTVSRHEFHASFRRHLEKQVALRFKQLDRDRDHRVTLNEVAAMKGDRFARFDRNGDGYFTQSELKAVMVSQVEERLEQLLAQLDVDGDRTCSYEELTAHRTRIAAARQEKQQRQRIAVRVSEKTVERTEQPQQAKAAPKASRVSF